MSIRLITRPRLNAGLGLLAAMLLVVAALALWQLAVMRASVQALANHWLPSIEHLHKLNAGSSELRSAELRHVLSTDDIARAGIETTMRDLRTALEQDHQTYVNLISSTEERQRYEAIAAEWTLYLQIHDRVLGLARQTEYEQARVLLEGDSKAHFDRSSAMLMGLVELKHQGIVAEREALHGAYEKARRATAAVAVLGLVLAAAGSLCAFRMSLSQAVKQFLFRHRQRSRNTA